MYTYFPIIYDDELLFSMFARFHSRSLNRKDKKTIEELGLHSLNPILPKDIEYFMSKLSYFNIPNENVFLKKHTLYNYYSNFLSNSEIDSLYKYVMHGNTTINTTLKTYVTFPVANLKYCNKCLREDYDKLGESYWRLSHQIPTVVICPKHFHPLIKSESFIEHQKLEMPKVNELSKSQSTLTKKTLFHAKNFIQQSLLLNSTNLNLFKKIRLQSLYLLLIEKGYIKESGKLDDVKLEKKLIDYFGIEFLKLIDFEWDHLVENIAPPIYYQNHFGPVETLVLINFLSGSLHEFLNNKYKLPSGEIAPFPCLNMFSNHYRKKNIDSVKVRLVDDKNQLVIKFSCKECKCNYDKIYRTIDWKLIETRIDYSEELRGKILSLHYIGNLSLDKISIKSNMNIIEIEGMLLRKNKNEIVNLEDIQRKRDEWLILESNNENKTIGELLRVNYSLYAFLYRNDYTWIHLRVLEISSNSINFNNLDEWRKRDKQVLLYLKEIVRKGILMKKIDVYYRICYEIDQPNLRYELPYLKNTNIYIERHYSLFEKLRKRNKQKV